MKRLLLLFLTMLSLAANASLGLTRMKVCSLTTPLGIDTPSPTFAWQLESDKPDCLQASYEITVRDADGRTLWRSGRVRSAEQYNIRYEGEPLRSRKAYTWTLTVTDNHRRKATRTEHFETAFLDDKEWQAQWIGRPTGEEKQGVAHFRRTFSLPADKRIRRARIYASALGVFTMTLNDRPVTDAVLEPGESEYERTILYSTYDVTNLLREGDNLIGARLAGGIYDIQHLPGRFSKGEVQNNGRPALIAELHVDYTDGTTATVLTNTEWEVAAGPTLGSNWWGGEDYDARLQGRERWQQAVRIEPHYSSPHARVSGHGRLRSRMYEPLRVVEEWKAVDVRTTHSGGYKLTMIDFGRNFAGQYRFRLRGRPGQQISLRCGESLNPDGSVFMEEFYTGPADTYEVYTFRGDEEGETWGPEFMYHGFRYLQIIGLDELPRPEDFTALRIRSDVELVGSLHTSNPLINDIHTICRDAIASQLYNSITDCPHREKLGWLDVPNEMYNSLNANFDLSAFYHKVVIDCFDAQCPDGMVPSVAPFYMRVYEDDPNWGGTAILLPYRNWRYYGDRTLITRYYEPMCRLIDHYTAHTTPDGLIDNALSVLSDWGQETAGVSPLVPTEFTESATYYHLLRVMAEIAAELGHPEHAARFTQQAHRTRTAFNAKFYRGNGIYALGRQSEQALPLYYELVDEAERELVALRLAERVRADGYKVRTGEIALKPLLMSLARFGYNDIVWQMANQTDCPSYGYWVRQGYTTTPEYWDVGRFSQNHCMMDHIEEWFFTQLAGINNDGTAFDRILIRPYVPADLDSLDVTTRCPRGPIRTAWQRTPQSLRFTIDVPPGSQGTIVLPLPASNSEVLDGSGRPLRAGRNGIHTLSRSDSELTLCVGSGTYNVELKVGSS